MERDFGNKSLKEKYEEATGRKIERPPIIGESTPTQQAQGYQAPPSPVPFTIPAPNNPNPELRAPIQPPTEAPRIPENLAERMGLVQQATTTVPIFELNLPSGPYFYKNVIPDGRLVIKAIEQKEIDILNTEHLVKKNIAFDTAIDSCIVEPKISSNVLLTSDRVYVLFKLFELSKGTSEYTFTLRCPSCNQKNTCVVDFKDLDSKKKVMNLTENVFSVVLPMSKKTVRYHLLTGADRKEIENRMKILMSQTAASRLIDNSLTESLIRSIDEIENVLPNQKNEFIKHMLFGDSVALREHMNDNTPGINPVFDFSCVNCSFEEEMIIPITSAFFSMKG